MENDPLPKPAGARRVPLWVRWYARDALDGTRALSPMEELAYRRILDLIFASGDRLLDDDGALAWMTKTSRRWPAIKRRLIAIEKIRVEAGFIRNTRANAECSESARFVAQKIAAGTRSAGARRSLKNPKTASTDVATVAPTGVATNYKEEEVVVPPVVPLPLARPRRQAAPRSHVPEDWCPDEGGRAYAAERGVNLAVEVPAFRDHHLARGNTMASWPAAWRTWCTKSLRFGHAGRCAPRAATLGHPTLALDNGRPDDPWGIAGWCATCPGVTDPDTEDAHRGRFLLGGALLDVAAANICAAARLPPAWRGKLDALAGWLNGGICSGDAVEAIAKVAARAGYDPSTVRSLAYFDAAVRERRAA